MDESTPLFTLPETSSLTMTFTPRDKKQQFNKKVESEHHSETSRFPRVSKPKMTCIKSTV